MKDNTEINNFIKVIGLQFEEKYDSEENLRTLWYGRILTMTRTKPRCEDKRADTLYIVSALHGVNHVFSNFIHYVIYIGKRKRQD